MIPQLPTENATSAQMTNWTTGPVPRSNSVTLNPPAPLASGIRHMCSAPRIPAIVHATIDGPKPRISKQLRVASAGRLPRPTDYLAVEVQGVEEILESMSSRKVSSSDPAFVPSSTCGVLAPKEKCGV